MIRLRKREADKMQVKHKKHTTRATVIQEEKKLKEKKKKKVSRKKVNEKVYNIETNHKTEDDQEAVSESAGQHRLGETGRKM